MSGRSASRAVWPLAVLLVAALPAPAAERSDGRWPAGCTEGSLAGDEPVAIVRIQPRYPLEAYDQGIEGWVELTFAVTARGVVLDPVVAESEPPGVFDAAALDSVRRWRFLPRCVEGKWQPLPLARIVMQFTLADAYVPERR